MSNKKEYNLHPIQLEKIEVLQLSIKVKDSSPEVEGKDSLDSGDFGLYHAHSDYDTNHKLIAVKAGISIKDEDSFPFLLETEIMGIFSVDDENFPMDKLEHWARTNAPLTLYPYLREHVYGLTSRAGFDGGVILPLFAVPTLKFNSKPVPDNKNLD